MGKRDPRIDAYIARSAPFAAPILTRLRETVHSACPAVFESLKWSHPSFEYRGILCGMAAFKRHATFGFWKHALVVGGDARASEAMGSFGRLTAVSDLPSRSTLARLVKQAMQLNEDGVKVVRARTRPEQPIRMHPELKSALAKNKRARTNFEAFSPSHQREYLGWIADAKGDDTRERRIATAVEWLAARKSRNWKYERR